jgi:hypothetical protein
MPDPRILRFGHRALDAAATLLKIVGGVCLALGLLSTCGLAGLYGTSTPRGVVVVFAVALVVAYVAPGIGYLVLASHVKGGRRWAVTTAVAIAGLHLAYFVVSLAGIVVNLVRHSPAFNPAGLAVAGVLAVLLIVLIVKLARCYRPLRDEPPRGFEPVIPPPVDR